MQKQIIKLNMRYIPMFIFPLQIYKLLIYQSIYFKKVEYCALFKITLATDSYKFSVPLYLLLDLSVQKPYFFSLVNFDNVYNKPLNYYY